MTGKYPGENPRWRVMMRADPSNAKANRLIDGTLTLARRQRAPIWSARSSVAGNP
jgi:hypothetical protein